MPITNFFKKKLIFFDFDGVLVDTLDICARIIEQTNSYPDVYDHIRRMSDGNVIEELQKLHQRGQFQPDPHFHAKYAQKLYSLPLVKGVAEVIHDLKNEHDLAIVSSSQTEAIHSFLVKHNLHTHFEYIGGVDLHHRKTEKMLSQLRQRELRASESVFVTDTSGDILEAQEIGVPTIAVAWGYHSLATLQKSNPDAIVHAPIEILKQVQRLFARSGARV